MELGFESSSMTCPLGLSLTNQETSTITSAESPSPQFDRHQSSDSIDNHLVSLSLDAAAANNGCEDGDLTVERENNDKENGDIDNVSKDNLNCTISSDNFHTDINAAENGGEYGDRTVEIVNNGEENREEKRELEAVSKSELSGKSRNNSFHTEIAVVADNNGDKESDLMEEKENQEVDAEEKQELENLNKIEELNCRSNSNRYQIEIEAGGKGGVDGDHTGVRENHEEETVEEKREFENVSKDEGGEKELSRRSSNRFPVRPEAEDCTFYLRTGTCKFGMNCKFNHPPNNNKKFQTAKMKVKEECVGSSSQKVKEKDESVDKEQIDCKYFDRPGGCKFGKACKFNHIRKINPTLKLNFMGLPIRLGEKECPFYMRNGSCKFGANCRFNHPDPTSAGGPDASPRYSNGGSVFSPNASQSTLAPWSPTTLNENPPYMPLMFSPNQGVPTQSEWNVYQASVYPPERSIHSPPTYSMSSQLLERPEQILGDEFPERPGQPECSFFLRNGDCKYRSACKFHHPKSVMAQSPPCLLSDSGLPLRPGENICSYYSRYGICKYGPACKYDHPISHAHSALNVSPVDRTPVLGDSMVYNQAMAAES